MQALMCLCDRTFFFFSSNFVSNCLFFPYCSSSPRLLNSLINFFLACIFFFSSVLLLLCLLSSLLSFLYLSISICRHVCGGLSQSPISALLSSFLWLCPPFLIGTLFNPSLCPPSAPHVVSLSLLPLSFPPSLPPFTLCRLLCLFSPLCAVTGLFLLLMVMGGSTPLHNAANIFPTGDPTVAAAALFCMCWKKNGHKHPFSFPSNPYFSVSSGPAKLLLFSRGAVQQDWFVLASHWAPAS